MKRAISVVMAAALMLVSIPMQGSAEDIIVGDPVETEALQGGIDKNLITDEDKGESLIEADETMQTECAGKDQGQTELFGIVPEQTITEGAEIDGEILPENDTDAVADCLEIASMEEIDTIPATVSETYGTTEDGFEYRVLEAGNAEITDYNGTQEGNLVIPSTIDDSYKVTSIGNSAFSGCSGFTGSLIIPESVTSIGASAFYGCSGFTGELKLPKSLASIESATFYDCSGFTGGLNLPDNLTSIGASAFDGCSGFVGNLTIPESVTSIGNHAFYGCSGFTGSLSIPKGVTSIEDGVFWECSGFTGNLSIPEGVTSIGDLAFDGCSGFKGSLSIPEGVTSIGGHAFEGCRGFTGELKLPEGLVSIGDYAFCACRGFTGELKLSESMVSIGDWAFQGCDGFTGELKLPESLTSIRNGTFMGCHGLTGELKLPKSLVSIRNNAFNGCSGFTGSLSIPESVVSIGDYAFEDCSGFTEELNLSDNLMSIGNYAFWNCIGFTGSLSIPESVTSIGEGAFCNCNSLKGELRIPSGCDVGKWAFDRCNFSGGSVWKVTFDSAGGTQIGSQMIGYNSCARKPETPEKPEYDFEGWYLEGEAFDFETIITKNIVLTAQWRYVGDPSNPKPGTDPNPDPKPGTDPTPGTNPTPGTSVTPGQKPGTVAPSVPTVKIKVGKATISSLKNSKKKAAVLKLKKVSGAKGYEVVYSTNKKFKKSVKRKTTKKLSVTLKKLKKNKTYYVKARAYKFDSNGAKVYGKYSKVKKVKIRK